MRPNHGESHRESLMVSYAGENIAGFGVRYSASFDSTAAVQAPSIATSRCGGVPPSPVGYTASNRSLLKPLNPPMVISAARSRHGANVFTTSAADECAARI